VTPLETKGKVSIIMMQCGSIRFRETDRKQAAVSPFKPKRGTLVKWLIIGEKAYREGSKM
jgi:hypothetical protein